MTDERPELDLDEAREAWHDHLAAFVEEAPDPVAAAALTLNSALILVLETCGREWALQQLQAALERVALYDAKPTKLQ